MNQLVNCSQDKINSTETALPYRTFLYTGLAGPSPVNLWLLGTLFIAVLSSTPSRATAGRHSSGGFPTV